MDTNFENIKIDKDGRAWYASESRLLDITDANEFRIVDAGMYTNSSVYNLRAYFPANSPGEHGWRTIGAYCSLQEASCELKKLLKYMAEK